jgi:hypothetical protein
VAKSLGLFSWRDLVGKTQAEVWLGDPAAIPSDAAIRAVLAVRPTVRAAPVG